MNAFAKLGMVALAAGGVVWGGLYVFGEKSLDGTPLSLHDRMNAADAQLGNEQSDVKGSVNSTIETFIAERQENNRQLKTLRDSVTTLSQQLAKVSNELNGVKSEKDNGIDQSDKVTKLQKMVDDLQNQIETIQNEQTTNTVAKTDGDIDKTTLGISDNAAPTDIKPINSDGSLLDVIQQPINSVLDNNPPGSAGGQVDSQGQSATQAIVWHEPNDVSYKDSTTAKGTTSSKFYPDVTNKFKNLTSPIKTLTKGKDSESSTTNSDNSSNQDKDKDKKDLKKESTEKEIYTIPALATLIGSVNMTSIIGRVPIDNTLSNPFKFKIIVGAENLASNGIHIPNIDSMMIGGKAEGDYTLQCARGTITKALFTFKDGTIRSVKGENLGYISDEYGTPCIAGTYISNFPQFVATQAGLAAGSAFASAIADGATTTTTSGVTGTTTSVVNNATKNALGEGLSGGINTVIEWQNKRQKNAFDAVVVEAGQPIEIHIEEQLNIDYDTKGRKVINNQNIEDYLSW